MAGNVAQVEDYLAQAGQIAYQGLKDMRLLIHELRPAGLEQENLVGALQQRLDAVEGRAGVETRLLVDELKDLPAHCEEELYRIAQEALNNALKHAAATSVTVQLKLRDNWLELEVADNGRGFDPGLAAGKGGLGLTSMRERAEKLGGSLTLISAPAYPLWPCWRFLYPVWAAYLPAAWLLFGTRLSLCPQLWGALPNHNLYLWPVAVDRQQVP